MVHVTEEGEAYWILSQVQAKLSQQRDTGYLLDVLPFSLCFLSRLGPVYLGTSCICSLNGSISNFVTIRHTKKCAESVKMSGLEEGSRCRYRDHKCFGQAEGSFIFILN